MLSRAGYLLSHFSPEKIPTNRIYYPSSTSDSVHKLTHFCECVTNFYFTQTPREPRTVIAAVSLHYLISEKHDS